MRRPVSLLFGLVTLVVACDKKSEPPPVEHAAPSSDAAGQASDPRRAPPARLPEWTFDTDDPARDYVGRYLRATMRYGTETACVVLSRSTFRNGENVVDVRNPADGTCGKPTELRDTFLANVSGDRLRIEDEARRPPLRPWPDGSLPGDGPGLLATVQDLRKWQTPVREIIKKEQLYPTRVQLYGRGTYPVVTLAGWHAKFDPKGDIAALKPVAQELCTANAGSPMAFMTGLGNTLLLRIDCPENPHWEDLRL